MKRGNNEKKINEVRVKYKGLQFFICRGFTKYGSRKQYVNLTKYQKNLFPLNGTSSFLLKFSKHHFNNNGN